MTEDEMVGWHHQLNWHEFEQAPGIGDGQGGLAWCSPWGFKESDTTEWLNWTNTHFEFLSWMDSGFRQMLFQRLLRWACVFCLLFMWCIIFIDLHMMNYPCIPHLNLMHDPFNELLNSIFKFFWGGIFHLYSWKILVYSFLVVSLSDFGMRVMLAS